MSDTKPPADRPTQPPVPSADPASRLPHLVDLALDVHEQNMEGGKAEVKQRAAESILDRAGYSKAQAEKSAASGETIPAEALAQVIKGLAHVFGAASTGEQARDVTESVHKPPSAAQSIIKQHTESAEGAPPSRLGGKKKGETAAEPAEAASRPEKTTNSDQTEEHRAKKSSGGSTGGLPDSLLSQYRGAK